MELTTIKAIGEFGGIGIAGFAVYLLWKLSVNHSKHFTDAILKNTQMLTKLCDCIDELKNKFK